MVMNLRSLMCLIYTRLQETEEDEVWMDISIILGSH
jgi:hypothetical protein